MSHKRTTPQVTRRGALRLAAVVAGLGIMGVPQLVLADTKTDLANAQSRLKDAEAKLADIAAEYEELSITQSKTLDELYGVENKIEETSKRIEELEKDLAAKQDELSKSVREEYKDGKHGVVDLILAATTIEELISNIYYFDKVSAQKAQLIQEVKDAHEKLENQKAELEKQREELQEVSRAQEEQLEAMRDKQLEAQQLIDGLDQEVRELMKKRDAELFAAQQEAAAARKQREEAAKAEAEKQKQEASSTSTQQQDASGSSKQETSTSNSADAKTTTEEPKQDDTTPQSTPESEPEPEPEAASGSAGRGGNGTGSAAAVIASCQSTPSPGAGLCAGWCSNVMANAGYGYVGGNANDMYAEFCFSSNRADLMPGMAVAVSSHPHTTMGSIYGHIGMYIGGGMMMDNIGYIRTISVDEWCSYYGATVSPRWGWLNGIVLT